MTGKKAASPAVALLLSLGAVDAAVGLVGRHDWNMPYPDSVGAWDADIPVYRGAGAAVNLISTSATTGLIIMAKRNECVNCIRTSNVWCSKYQIYQTGAAAWK